MHNAQLSHPQRDAEAHLPSVCCCLLWRLRGASPHPDSFPHAACRVHHKKGLNWSHYCSPEEWEWKVLMARGSVEVGQGTYQSQHAASFPLFLLVSTGWHLWKSCPQSSYSNTFFSSTETPQLPNLTLLPFPPISHSRRLPLDSESILSVKVLIDSVNCY